jgi:hypothetical protein
VTDTAAAEAPAESVPPEAPAAPAPEVESKVESEDNRTAREKVLDHFADCDDPDQSVAQIIQGTGLSRNTCEQAIFRAAQSEQLQRVSQGVYRLAPPKPPSPPKPEPPSPNGHTNDEWIARILAWQADPVSWKIEVDGPPPNNPYHRIPQDVVGQFKDRQKREREKAAKQDAEAAAARQAAADRQLRDQLLAAANGNFQPNSPDLDDMTCIREVLKTVPLDRVLMVIRQKVDRRSFPGNPRLVSWSEPAFLKAVAENFCRALMIPGLIKEWSVAGKSPGSPPTLRL